MKFSVIDDSEVEITRPHDPEDRWSGEDTSTSHSIQGICLVPDGIKDYYEINSEFDLYPNTDYYLVYVIYSTGDSFSHHEGVIEYINLYLTKDRAEACVKAIKDHNLLWCSRWGLSSEQQESLKKKQAKALKKDKYAKYGLEIISESGKEIHISIPWTGYFESLTDATYEVVQLDNE